MFLFLTDADGKMFLVNTDHIQVVNDGKSTTSVAFADDVIEVREKAEQIRNAMYRFDPTLAPKTVVAQELHT